ncbi:hypothetical protein CDL12_15056 [Handroanthus impetiginosus]|uniref:Cytochrome P450 CYP2 subfamily n=1 Tax=Handroanthus impetiginosus TaxID=429701 RepID=A0A2G9H489_9LAMI|nr:hypothetical protein CDL12_15056 [Handroanthus impetiginosus]
MDSSIQLLLTILSCVFAFVLFVYFYNQLRKPNKNQIPRAGGALPVIGHLHLFGGKQLIHRALGSMADKYGPAFAIRLGSQEHLVVSSWEIAKECFTTHDKVFSDRPQLTATKILGYNFAMFGLAPYGSYWRDVRKIVTLELLSHRRIEMLHPIRATEVQASLKSIYDSWVAKQNLKQPVLVEMKQWFSNVLLNTAVQTVGGKRFIGDAHKHKKVMRDFLYFFGVFVLSDAIPALKWLDLQGHEKAMKKIAKKLDDLLEEWLEEHKQRRRISGENKEAQDFMDVMLNLLKDSDFADFDADTVNKATCLNLVLAGSDTMVIALTWALSLLLNNPDELKKAQEELDTYVSRDRHV